MNKDFSILEKVLCNMADNLYQPVEFPLYVEKLEKEFAELMQEFEKPLWGVDRVKDEMADVLVFLLRISNKMDISGKDLILHAMTKMLKRVSDTNYNNI